MQPHQQEFPHIPPDKRKGCRVHVPVLAGGIQVQAVGSGQERHEHQGQHTKIGPIHYPYHQSDFPQQVDRGGCCHATRTQ